MVCSIPNEMAEKSCQVLEKLVGRSNTVTNNGSQKEPLSKDLRKSIWFRGSAASWTQLFKYIFCECGFLSSSVVFCSVSSVGSLVSHLQDGPSRREIIFWL